MRLSQLTTGQKAEVVKIVGHGAFRKRLMEMGFVKGQEVDVLLHAPLRDPIKYRILGYEVSLRRAEAELVEVALNDTTTEYESTDLHRKNSTLENDSPADQSYSANHNTINIALIGNPNCGKTSLFNNASGAHEHVGNYSGVTVDAKQGTFEYNGYRFNIVDLPGTYSLDSYSPEELYVRRYLKNETPDVIINVVVASNLERNLYLTTELIDMDRKMVIALNMYDELERSGDIIDTKLLGEMIGVPIVPTVSRTGFGTQELWQTIIDVFEDKHSAVRHVHVNLGQDIEHSVNTIKNMLKANDNIDKRFSPRYLAIKLLEKDKEVENSISAIKEKEEILNARDIEVKHIEKIRNEDISSAIASEKYGFIAGALAETRIKGETDITAKTQLIDSIVTNKVIGFPLFLFAMFGVFWATFELGSYPMDWIESGVSWISNTLQAIMPNGALKE